MEILSIIFMLFAIVLLVIPAVTINNKAVFPIILISILMFFCSKELAIDANKGKPALLNVLTVGEKYEVVAVVVGGEKKYVVVKSLTNEKQERLRFIGPLINSDTLSVGDVCIKTAEGSLDKFLRH